MTTEVKKPEGRGWLYDEVNKAWYRIRKLTERECFRLQGVSDMDIDIIQGARFERRGKKVGVIPLSSEQTASLPEKSMARIPKSQQYKMAGNSITVDVLFYVYNQMFFPTFANQETLF